MADRHERVKYYSDRDGSIGLQLPVAERKLKELNHALPLANVNDAIELYNISRIISLDVKLKTWTSEYQQEVRSISAASIAMIGHFFSKIIDANFIVTFQTVGQEYGEDFWSLFEYYKLYSRISENVIIDALNRNSYILNYLLQHKGIVTTYSCMLTNRILSSPQNAEILISEYLYKKNNPSNVIHMPTQLTNTKREELINLYINYPEMNPNYLRLIFESRDNTNLPLGAKTKHAAHQQYDKYVQNHFSKHSENGVTIRQEISFAPDYEDAIKVSEYNNNCVRIVYGKKWVDNNLDFPTLWNNFIYMLDFVDYQFRCNFQSNPISASVFEMIFNHHGKSTYNRNSTDFFKNSLFNHTLEAYRHLLALHKINIEDMITWFFSKYLLEEFQVEDFIFCPPSENTTYLEKCKIIATEIDSILKQFDVYSREGYIDRSLFEFSTDSLKIDNIGSLISQKYFYAANDVCRACMNCLFSNQSALTYTKDTKKEYATLYEMLTKRKVLRREFHDHNLPAIDYLVTSKCLVVKDDDSLALCKKKVLILKDLYHNQVSLNLYFEGSRDELEDMQLKGEIRFASTLFSEPEQDYLSYVLTQSKFSNGLDLRNKYVHGNYPIDANEQKNDYFELLKTIVFIVIKINQEFCYRTNALSPAINNQN